MTCTSGINDSLPRLSPTSDDDRSSNLRTDHSNETSLFVMQNRPPCVSPPLRPEETKTFLRLFRLWNEQSQVYQLDFGGRVTLESAKNFQIEFKGKQVRRTFPGVSDRVDASLFQVIQFGRIENNCYTLDFEWPFSPLQAFAVALANITQRLK